MRAPAFWAAGGGGVWPAVLDPIGRLYGAATARRVAQPGWRAPVAVLCCGNATAGGAGKTTLALELGARLTALGGAPHAVTRGYGGRVGGPLRVDPALHDAAMVGDEALLLAAAMPCWVARDRAAGARAAVAAGAGAIVLDDGLQHPTLAKDVSFLVIDGATGFGNGRLIPAGPLREPVAAAASRCRAAVLIGADATGALAMLPRGLPVLRATLRPGAEAAALAGRRVFAFAGIAHPEKFFATLRTIGATVAGQAPFPDHHRFTPREIAAIRREAAALGAVAVTTRKDAVRLPPGFRADVSVLSIGLDWADPAALEALLRDALNRSAQAPGHDAPAPNPARRGAPGR